MSFAFQQPIPAGVMPAPVLAALVRQDYAGLVNGTPVVSHVTVQVPMAWNTLTGAGSPYHEAIFRGR